MPSPSSLAKELGARKIRVNAINPGMVETEGTHAGGITRERFPKADRSQTPLGRIGQPQDIATAVAFLASDDSVVDHRRNSARFRRTSLMGNRQAIHT